MNITTVNSEPSPLSEVEYGKICPRISWKEFLAEAKQPTSLERFEVDMMGNDPYEELKSSQTDIMRMLKAGNLELRILILDPFVVEEQKHEILCAQQSNQSTHSILPPYDGLEILSDGSCPTSTTLTNDLAEKVGGDSSLEVRLTKILLYCSVIRVGAHMMISPYGSPLSKSFSIYLTDQSPIFQKYKEEFDSIWEDRLHTRVLSKKNGSKDALAD